MFPYSNNLMRDMTEPATRAFEFWVSFWPVAPVFGVEWRFAELAGKMSGGVPLTPFTVHSGVRPKPNTTSRKAKTRAKAETPEAKVIEAVEELVEEAIEVAKTVAPVEDAALEPQVEKAEAAIEEVMEPAAPVTEETVSAEAASEEQSSLDLAGEAGPSKPLGLMKKAPKDADDLKLIKGIGPGLEKQLNGLGVYTFRQVAAFSDDDLAWIDDNLTSFKGRCFRDDWVGQAKTKMH